MDTLKGKVKPNRVSFLLWSLAPLIAFFAEIKQGVGIQALMTFIVGFLPLTIFIASFVNKKAVWNLTGFDLICGALSIVGLFLWYITKSGNIAIIFSILADALAAMPTVVKAFNFPETESAWPYFASTISAILTLLTVWNIANIAFPIYIVLITLVIFFSFNLSLANKSDFCWVSVHKSTINCCHPDYCVATTCETKLREATTTGIERPVDVLRSVPS